MAALAGRAQRAVVVAWSPRRRWSLAKVPAVHGKPRCHTWKHDGEGQPDIARCGDGVNECGGSLLLLHELCDLTEGGVEPAVDVCLSVRLLAALLKVFGAAARRCFRQ